MLASRVLVPVALIAASGCSLYYRDILRVDPTPRTATVVDSVRVLAQEPAQTYKVVALVSVSTNLGESSLRHMTRALAVEAAKLGANGILVGPESITHTKDQRILTGRAIVFDSVAPPVQPALGKPSYTRRIVMWSILGGVLAAGTVAAILAADSEPIMVSCDIPGSCFPGPSR